MILTFFLWGDDGENTEGNVEKWLSRVGHVLAINHSHLLSPNNFIVFCRLDQAWG